MRYRISYPGQNVRLIAIQPPTKNEKDRSTNNQDIRLSILSGTPCMYFIHTWSKEQYMCAHQLL